MQRSIIQSLYTCKHLYNVSKIMSCMQIQCLKYCRDVKQPSWIPSSASGSESQADFAALDPDEFGSLAGISPHINEELSNMPEELEDRIEHVIVDDTKKKSRRPPAFYHILIKKLLDEKKLADAIDVLETRILKKDHLQGDYYTWNLLINGCARAGYCQKAFKLYRAMKVRGIKMTPATYTGLFNACAESPFSEDALNKLNHLRQTLNEKGVELNLISYNAIIKAYARQKDVHSAFLVVDEMLTKKFTLLPESFNFLLQACISDKECGLRHALMTWHKMRAKKVTPNLFTYNLLIRCIRDCEFGDEEDVKEVILRVMRGTVNPSALIEGKESTDEEHKQLIKESEKSVECAADESTEKVPDVELAFEEIDKMENRPNLLAKNPHLGTIVSINNVKDAADRLLLLGGFKTLLNEMKNDGVEPDIKTYTQLLNIMPSTVASERYLLEEMTKSKIPIDIDFCNMLIKQRAYRCDYEGAKEVLKIIQQNYLHPDIITFGVLAMCCGNEYQAEELIRDMREYSYRLNIEIIGAMLKKATCMFKFSFAEYLMRLVQKLGIKPSELFMEHLENLDKRASELRRKAKRKDDSIPSYAKKLEFHENSLIFKDFLAQWKKQVEVYKPEHPFKQFHTLSGDAPHEIDTNDIHKYSKNNRWTKDKLIPHFPPGHKNFGKTTNEKRISSDVKKYEYSEDEDKVTGRSNTRKQYRSKAVENDDSEEESGLNWRNNYRKERNGLADDDNEYKPRSNWRQKYRDGNSNFENYNERRPNSHRPFNNRRDIGNSDFDRNENLDWGSLKWKKSPKADPELVSNSNEEPWKKLNWKKNQSKKEKFNKGEHVDREEGND